MGIISTIFLLAIVLCFCIDIVCGGGGSGLLVGLAKVSITIIL